MTNSAAMNWGTTNGEAVTNDVTYMKLAKGTNQIRVVSNILRRYVYWLENAKGKKAPFENLDFNRDTEKFENTGLNPVKELGLQARDWNGNLEFDKNGQPKPLGSKKAYMCQVVNRATNQIEYMELKTGVFNGIKEVMAKLNDPKQIRRFADPEYRVPNPMFIDVIFNRTGEKLSTEYKVDILETMDMVQDEDTFKAMIARHKEDEALLANLKPIEEVFPRQTYSEQKEAINKFLAAEDDKPAQGGDDNGDGADNSNGGWGTPNANAEEAMNELDD